MPPQVVVQQHAVHEQRDRTLPSFDVIDASGRGTHGVLSRRDSASIHGSALPCRRRGCLRFLQLLRAVIATHFDGFATDLHLDRASVERVIARRASFLCHDRISTVSPTIGWEK